MEKDYDKLEKTLKIMASLSKIIRHLYYINMKDFSFEEVGGKFHSIDEIIGRKGDAKASMKAMLDHLVLPAHVTFMREFVDLDTLNERMKGHEFITQQFCYKDGSWYQGIFISVSQDDDGNCMGILWAVRNINEYKQNELEDKKNITQQMYALKALSCVYHASYYIDLDNDDYYELLSDENNWKFEPSGKAQAELYWRCDNRIVPEYQKSMHEFVDLSTLSLRLKNTDTISIRSRLVTGDWVRIRFIAASRHEDNTIKSCTFVVRNINQEILEEKNHDENLESRMEEIQALNIQLEENQTRLEESIAEQEAQMEEISALNTQLQENQTRLEESMAEQESQLEEIQNLNARLEDNRSELEASVSKLEMRNREIESLNNELRTEQAMALMENHIVEALSASYKNVYLINKKDATIEIRKLDGYVTSGLSDDNAGPYPYDAVCKSYIENRVFPKDKPMVTSNMKLSHLLEVLKENPEYTYNYRIIEDGGIHYYQGKYADVDANYIVCGFQNIDEIVAEEEEKNRILKMHMKEVTSLNDSLTEYNTIISNAGFGIWHIYLKDGSLPRMRANDKMAELLGIDAKTMTEEEIYDAWYNRILPDAIPSVNASVGEMMSGKFSENTYLWNHPVKGNIYVRCGGTEYTLSDGTHVLRGYHADVNDIVLEEERHKKETEEARRQIADAYGMIEGFSHEYHTIWVVSKETSKMRLIRSTGVTTIKNAVQMGKDLPLFDSGFDKYIETYVMPEDRLRMHKEIAFSEILRQLEVNDFYSVNYLRRDDSGHVGYHQIAFANADTEDGKKQFVYGFRDIDKMVREEQKQKEALKLMNEKLAETLSENEEQLHIVEALSHDYTNVFYINLETGHSRSISLSDSIGNVIGIGNHEDHLYEETIRRYISSGRIHPEDLSFMKESMKLERIKIELLDKDEFSGNYRTKVKGIVHYMQFKYRKVKNTSHVILGIQNIDKLVETEVARNKELETAKSNAEAANVAKTSFLFNMSHDIRTPMNAIIGFRDLLEKNQEDPIKRSDYLNKIKDASGVLLSIINNVLEMARIEKGTLEIEEQAWSAIQFNDTLWSVFHEMMEEKKIQFTRTIDVKHNYVYCDPTKLREIFINILSNAYKYTNAGGTVHMELHEIPSDKKGFALYKTIITDTGIGMSKEFLPHIFEEFSRERNTTDAKVEGTGLGMPIVKRLVELLGGTIEVESEKGKGSSFTVIIPHRIAERASLTEVKKTEIDPEVFKGKRILLTEDNDLNAEITEEVLSEAGFVSERAENGLECVSMLEGHEAGYYDLILMDIQMPVMNGYEATKKIRNLTDEKKKNIRIIAMTANAFEEDKRAALDSGMNGHLAKPVNIPEMMGMLSKMLK